MYDKRIFRKAGSLIMILFLTFALMPKFNAYADDGDWTRYAGSDTNNGVVNGKVVTDIKEANTKWTFKAGQGWSNSPTPPVIIGNYAYTAVKDKIREIDLRTGEETEKSKANTSKLAGKPQYAMNPILYEDGLLFVPLTGGIIEAVDINTLQPVWHTEIPGPDQQAVSNISYKKIAGKGYVYTGTWGGETKDGYYYCVDVKDGKVTNGVKEFKWKIQPSVDFKNVSLNKRSNQKPLSTAPRGFYWVGAYITDRYLVVGTDDGDASAATLLMLNPLTGEVLDYLQGDTDNLKGDLRSSIAFHDGNVYFTSKEGYLYKVNVNVSRMNFIPLGYIKFGSASTATPLVYGGRIYVGYQGGAAFTAGANHGFAVILDDDELQNVDNEENYTGGSMLYKVPSMGYPQAAAILNTAYENEDYDKDGQPDHRVYIYFTFNAPPGGIYCFHDDPKTTSYKEENKPIMVYEPEKDKQQYCISPLAMDKKGTLYYKNDSGNIFAVERNAAYMESLVVKDKDKKLDFLEGDFNVQKKNYTVNMPDGVEDVTMEFKAAENATVKENTSGDFALVTGNTVKVHVPADMAEKKVTLKVEKDGDTREYNVTFKNIGNVATLSKAMGVEGNSPTDDKIQKITPELSDKVNDYEVNTSDSYKVSAERNFYVALKDPEATVKVIPKDNYSKDKTLLDDEGNIKTTNKKVGTTDYITFPVKGESERGDKIVDDISFTVKVTSKNKKVVKEYNFVVKLGTQVTGISLNKQKLTLKEGASEKLTATVVPDNASNKKVTWTTGDAGIATVDENGNVKAIKKGTTTVKATTVSGKHEADCTVTVEEDKPPVEMVKVLTSDDGNATLTLEKEVEKNKYRLVYKLLADKSYKGIKDSYSQTQEIHVEDVKTGKEVPLSELSAKASLQIKISKTVLKDESLTRKLYHVKADGELEEVKQYNVGKDQFTFETTHFSNYVLGVPEDKPVVDPEKKTKADEVSKKIDSIGEVTLDKKDAIKEARKAYDALDDETKKMVGNLEVLEDAEKKLAELETQKAKADEVIKKIDSIGEVTLDKKEAIKEARKAYDALDDETKKMVGNLKVLEDAEKKLAELEKDNKPKPTPTPTPTPEPTPVPKPENPDTGHKQTKPVNKHNGAVSTGDSEPILGSALVLGISLIGLAFMRKRRIKK